MRLNTARFDTAAARHAAFLTGLGWLSLVAFLSLMPMPPTPPGALSWDKAQHALAYAFLGWWWLQALEGRRPIVVVAGLIGYGILIECLQGLSGVRHFSPADMLANGLGVMAGLLLCMTPAGRLLAWLAPSGRRRR